MRDATEDLLQRATKEQLTEALLSACQELALLQRGVTISINEKIGSVSGGSLNNQVVKHLAYPDLVIEE